MLSGTYEEFFAAIAASAAALTGLLFVALSVAPREGRSDNPVIIGQVRAGAALLAFTNALAVSLFGLVPGNNVGYPAIVAAVIGIFFAAAGTRSILANPYTAKQHVRRQIVLIAALLLTFGFELLGGIGLVAQPHDTGSAQLVGNLLVGLLLLGIGRSWEFVGDRDTGIIASIAVLAGHEPGGPAPSTPADRADRADRAPDGQDGTSG